MERNAIGKVVDLFFFFGYVILPSLIFLYYLIALPNWLLISGLYENFYSGSKEVNISILHALYCVLVDSLAILIFHVSFGSEARSKRRADEIAANSAKMRKQEEEYAAAIEAKLWKKAAAIADDPRRKSVFWIKLHPQRFETEIGILFQKSGYAVEQTSYVGDGGVDLILVKDGARSIVQCKRYSKPVGPAPIRELYGVLGDFNAQEGIFVTTSGYTDGALKFANGKPLHLIGMDGILEMATQAPPHSDGQH